MRPSVSRQLIYERPVLYPKQEAAIFTPARSAIVEATPKSGKTVGCMAWLLEQAVRGRRGRRFWWVAPVEAQADIAWRRFRDGLPPSPIVVKQRPREIHLPNGAVLCFKSADHPDSLYGEDVYAAVIDEAPRCKEEAWHAVRSTLTATGGAVRIIGNVKGRRNWAYRLARQAEAGAPDMHYARLTAPDAIEAGIFDAAELADAERVLPAAAYRELYFAEASDDQGNPFGLTAVRNGIRPLSDGAPVAWGWDLAKSRDWTAGIAVDREGIVCRFERFQRSWEHTIATIGELTGGTEALIDSTGVGDPIVERLQQLAGQRFAGYKFSALSKQQLMEGLAVAIQTGRVHYPEGPIVTELEAFEYVVTRTGVRYSAPEGTHDDCVVALALAVQQYTRVKQAGTFGLLFVDGSANAKGASYVERQVRECGSWFPGD